MRSFLVEEVQHVDSVASKTLYRRPPQQIHPGLTYYRKGSLVKTPLLHRNPRERVLATYTGRIENVDGDKVYLTLAQNGDLFEAAFSKSTFSPGAEIVEGRGTVTEHVILPSGHDGWRNRVLRPKVIEPEILERMRTRLSDEFDGTGL